MVRKGKAHSHGKSRPGYEKDQVSGHRIRHVARNSLSHSVQFIRQSGAAALNAVLPERCGLCLTPDPGGYCNTCQELLPWIGTACRFCAASMAAPGICGQCQKSGGRVPYDHLIIPFRYQPPIASHIQQLKYNQQLAMVPVLAKMLALDVLSRATPLPQVLVPVPLYPARLRQRGFNQAALIANETGRLLQIPVDHKFLCRLRNTRSQTDLDEADRVTNMRDAFAVTGKQRYDAVAVIDDVITSGATIANACKALARSQDPHHPLTVSVWAIAKT